jgi:putative FmdB family regulatory protein
MPTYEYACSKCQKTFEVFQSMKDKPLTKCPDQACKGKVKRLLGTGAGLIFKGSGFYITDYRSEGYKSAAKSDSAAASSTAGSSGDSGSAAKAEPKPAAKAGGESKPAAKSKKAGG